MEQRLLDTHVLIWLAEKPADLSANAIANLTATHELYVSHATVWEMAVKIKTGKLSLSFPLPVFIYRAMLKHQLQPLAITTMHIYATLSLPLHHRDPFDRMLIAQALHESMPILSKDADLDAYGVNRIW